MKSSASPRSGFLKTKAGQSAQEALPRPLHACAEAEACVLPGCPGAFAKDSQFDHVGVVLGPLWGALASPPGHVSTIGLGPAAQDWVTPQGPEVTATHAGLDFVSTGHQAKISQVPFCSLPAHRQRPVLTPAGVGEGQCQEPPGSNSPSAPSRVYSRPHHFQPQQAPQEGSRCPHSTRHPECFHSARRERVPGGGQVLAGTPSQNQVPSQGEARGSSLACGCSPLENLLLP